jgi:hypothetical protein
MPDDAKAASPGTITIGSGYEIPLPRSEEGYVVAKDEWAQLVKRVEAAGDQHQWSSAAGWFLLGIAGPALAFLPIITYEWQPVSWFVGAACLTTGTMVLFVVRRGRRERETMRKSIVDDMRAVAWRHEATTPASDER